MPARERPLWTCPKCGKLFVTKNTYHSCTVVTLDEHFRDRPNAWRCFQAMRQVVEEKGPVTLVLNKGGVGFMTRVRFAGAQVRKDYLRAGVWLKRKISSPRFVKTEQWGPRDFGYFFPIRDPADIDDEVRALLHEARAVGDQEHLR
jgi:hypothetical protein